MPLNRPNHRMMPLEPLAIIALGVLFIAATVTVVSAANIYDETYSEDINDYIAVIKNSYTGASITPSGMFISKSMATPNFIQMYVATPASLTSNYATLPSTGQTTVTIYKSNLNNENVQYYGTGTLGYFKYKSGSTDYLQTWLEIDPGANYGIITGNTYLKFVKDNDKFVYPTLSGGDQSNLLGNIFSGVTTSAPGYIARFGFANGEYFKDLNRVTHNIFMHGSWKTQLIVDTNDQYINDRADIQIIRSFPEAAYNADVYVLFGDTVYSSVALHTDLSYYINEDNYPFTVAIKSLSGTWYNNTFFALTPGPDPTPGKEPTVLRKGTVTMTDNNGTTITGFEVTAVNAYTDESYNVSTDTDVVVMTLPMDRTITLRNPQTGEYEETTVGYYRFYGQAPGYKMLNEDGIQVAVMPEKYGAYQLCDILVTSESGYLTGQHQFQIRSRSDNSILQTGTISAKSATTGDWYNTTVSGGIATLILPYDTSNLISQYAGNYYVYATSPGYEDSDYGTQIVVMPHTVSDINNVFLTPIGGIPTPGNVTLRIQVFSETGPGVVNAGIFIAGVDGAGVSVWDTYTASSTGYLAVSVPGNSTYDIVASGAGYYDSARRIEVFTEDPALIEIKLYLSGGPTVEPTTQPTGWPTDHPTPQPTGGIPDEDDDSEGFLMQAVRGIGLAFGVGFATAKLIFGMLLSLSIGYATAKQLRGGAAEFGIGLMGGTLLGVLIGLLPVWIIVVLLLVVGLYIGNRYVGGANNG